MLARGILKASTRCNKIFNVGTEKSTNLTQLRSHIEKICEESYEIKAQCPEKSLPMRKGDVQKLLSGDENILKSHKTIDMIDGLKRSAWFYMKEQK